MISAKITLKSVTINDPNNVGQVDDWLYTATVNSISLEEKEKFRISLDPNSKLNFEIKINEKEVITDIGYFYKSFYYDEIKYKELSFPVEVTENRGCNAGCTATILFIFFVE